MFTKISLDTAGILALARALGVLVSKFSQNANVQVGYETRYAIYVHEDLTAAHPVGQAKFLEEPARKMVDQITKVVRDRLAEGHNLSSAMFQGGRRLQWASMPLVPVDTGLLKSTVFTKLERLGN